MTIYNVQGPKIKLMQVEKGKLWKVSDKFSDEDWNFEVEERDEDQFTDLCESFKLKYNLV